MVGVWSCAYETTRGSSVGYPDVQILIDELKLLPVELKVGFVDDDRLRSKEIRPSQISWHHEFRKAGGKAIILVCTGNPSKMDAWAIPSTDRKVTSQHKQGWPLVDCVQWVKGGKLTQSLDELWNTINAA